MDNPIPSIYDLSLSDLKQMMVSLSQPEYRAKQVWQGLYLQLWGDPDQFTMLPAPIRKVLSEKMRFTTLIPSRVQFSIDGSTQKSLFELHDNNAIETVLMGYRERKTLCISTQVGCSAGCTFCATGQMGLTRSLTRGEIVEQVIYYARLLKENGEKITNIVIMGMGEPFHNYEATLSCIKTLNDHQGFNFGERRFTISTVGLIPMIERFANEKHQVNLAISLHAAEDDLRSYLVPINKYYPIKDLLGICRYYTNETGRRITFEWALIQDLNDSVNQAKILASLLKNMLCHVNIIQLNPTSKSPFQGSTRENAEDFREELERNNIPCTIRLRRGIDIHAGCGQLATRSLRMV